MRAGQAASRRVSVSKRDVSMVPSVSAVANCVAFVLKGYPRLSETFIAQEILALERRGLEILIVSLRPPTDRTTRHVASGGDGCVRADALDTAQHGVLGLPIYNATQHRTECVVSAKR